MNDSNILFWSGVMILGYTLGALVAFLFTFKPEIFVRREAKFYRDIYRRGAVMSNQEIDQSARPFWFFRMIDSMSHFVNNGVEHPEEFPRLMLRYRAVGCFIWAGWAFAVFFLVWGLVTGALSISK
jgi:hypothetical protein